MAKVKSSSISQNIVAFISNFLSCVWNISINSFYLQGAHPAAAPGIHRRGSLQLWQFLLALLNDPANQAAIVWTGRGMEFKLIEPEEVISLAMTTWNEFEFFFSHYFDNLMNKMYKKTDKRLPSSKQLSPLVKFQYF